MGKSITAGVRNKDGEAVVSQSETDTPILPVPQLERLHQFRPDIIDWVIQQTQIEAEYRREQKKKINKYVIIERTIGQVFAFLIGITGVLAGAYVAAHNQPWAGASIASVAISGLAVVFIKGHSNKK